MSLQLSKQAKCRCWHLSSSNPGRALHGSGRGSWRGEDHRDSKQVENIFFLIRYEPDFLLFGTLRFMWFQFLFPDILERGRCSPKVPACAIEQQASEVRMLLAYRNKCLFVKEGLCAREAGHLCAKEVFPALDITLYHSRQISRYPKIPLPDLRISGYFWVPRYPDVHLYLPCRAVKQPMLPVSHIYCQPLDEYLKYTQNHVSHLICVGSPVWFLWSIEKPFEEILTDMSMPCLMCNLIDGGLYLQKL